MSISPLVSGSRMLRDASWLFDREQEAADNRALAEYDRREAIEKAVDFSDLLEECCEFTGPQRETFMQALARGNASDLDLMHALFLQAKESIVKRRIASGE